MQTIFDRSTVRNIEVIDDTTVKIIGGTAFIRSNNFKELKGKYVFEYQIVVKNGGVVGICSDEILEKMPGSSLYSYCQSIHTNTFYNDGRSSFTDGWDIKNGSIIGFCIDLDVKTLYIYLDGIKVSEKNISNIKDKLYIYL